MGSFLYPRTIAVRRPSAQTGGGLLPYGGQTEANEDALADGIPASIQERKDGAGNPVGLPSDGTKPTYYIYIPRGSAALGLIKSRDIVVDDVGERYQVVAPYWDSLGYRLTVAALET